MKKFFCILLSLILFSLLLTGCYKGPERMDYSYNLLSLSSPIRAEGQFATLICPEDLSTDYVWQCELISGDLEFVYEAFVNDRDKQTSYSMLAASCKDNGVHIWQYRGKKACEAEFKLTQFNSETGGEIKSNIVNVTVDKKGNVRWN